MSRLHLTPRSKWSDRASRSLTETMADQRRKVEAEEKIAHGDPLSPAERAVIDAAIVWAASTGTEATLALRDRVAELHVARKAKAKVKVTP